MNLQSQLARLSAYVADRGSCIFYSALGYCIYDFDPLGFESFVNNVSKKVEI